MSAPSPTSREHHRDQTETMFTPVLRDLFVSDPAVVAVVFVDREGECVDYCGSVDPYEVKVVGAHMQVVLRNLRPSLEKLSMGELGELHIHAERFELVLRRIDQDYACIVMRREGGSDDAMLAALDLAIRRLRELSGLTIPRWDLDAGGIVVHVRESVGWGYAPDAIVESGTNLRVDAVLGRWEENGGLSGRPLVCFRVHTEDGQDCTLVYDAAHERWFRW